ncbi:hypothetical protein CBL_03219 [Carabus blaptoides fortunei]
MPVKYLRKHIKPISLQPFNGFMVTPVMKRPDGQSSSVPRDRYRCRIVESSKQTKQKIPKSGNSCVSRNVIPCVIAVFKNVSISPKFSSVAVVSARDRNSTVSETVWWGSIPGQRSKDVPGCTTATRPGGDQRTMCPPPYAAHPLRQCLWGRHPL